MNGSGVGAEGDALRYDSDVDLEQTNTSQAQLVLLTGLDKTVLEVGPATGAVAKLLKERGCRVTGIETDPATAQVAEQYFVRMIVGDVERMNLSEVFPEERFDVVIFGDVLEHLAEPQRVLENVSSVLAPGGSVVASIPNVAHASVRLALLGGRFRYTDQGLLDRTHLRFFDKEGVEELFAGAGYAVAEWRRVEVDVFSTELALRPQHFPSRLVEAAVSSPEGLTYQFVVTARLADATSRTAGHAGEARITSPEGLSPLWDLELRAWDLEHEVERLGIELAQKTAALSELEDHLVDLQEHYSAAVNRVGYRLLQRTTELAYAALPPGTRRRRLMHLPARLLRQGTNGQEHEQSAAPSAPEQPLGAEPEAPARFETAGVAETDEMAEPDEVAGGGPAPGLAGHDGLEHHIDHPDEHQVIEGAYVSIRGWAFHPSGIERVELRTGKGTVEIDTGIPRADVAESRSGHPRAHHSGFYADVDRTQWTGHGELWAHCGDGIERLVTEVNAELRSEDFLAAHERLLAVLACPSCHHHIEAQQPACPECGRPVEWLGEVPSFLGRPASPIARGEPVSRHTALEHVAKTYLDLEGGGIFLDAGAGWPPRGHPAMIQLEVERFPSTNVVADGAELPFADATFDGLMSHAVLEHVRDPFGYAKEVLRTLKPGARFMVHSAFLQPVHAYPNHFFNTTLEGLLEVFKGAKILEAGVAPSQRPWLALEWILRSYCAGFNQDEDRARFEQMRIGDLLGDMDENRPLAEFQDLREDSERELAAGVYALGER